jgi:hypothetical protein
MAIRRLCGLKSDVSLNGALVNVGQYDKARERWEVTLMEDITGHSKGKSMRVRTACLVEDWLKPGTAVLREVEPSFMMRRHMKTYQKCMNAMRVMEVFDADNVVMCCARDHGEHECTAAAHNLRPLIGCDAVDSSPVGLFLYGDRKACWVRTTLDVDELTDDERRKLDMPLNTASTRLD